MRTFARYAVVAAFLTLALVGTLALRAWRAEQLAAQGAEAQSATVARAFGVIEQKLGALEGDLLRRAEALARDPAALGVLRAPSDPAAREAVIERFAALELPEGLSAELYTPAPDLVAWNGPSFPLGSATRTTRFLSEVQTGIARDGALRWGLALWLPVREGGRVLGAVRLVRLLGARVPIRNRYLRDFDLASEWQAEVGIPFEIEFGPDLPPLEAGESSPARESYPVYGRDGAVLAHVAIPTPSVATLQAAARREVDDVVAFWVVLLAGWGLAGGWLVAEHLARRAVRSRAGAARAWGPVGGALLGLGAAWWGGRYLLLALGVPARWFSEAGRQVEGAGSGLAVFDPVYLASGVGGGVLGSVGELVVTALFALVFGAVWLRFAVRVLHVRRRTERAEASAGRVGLGWAAAAALGAVLSLTVLAVFAVLVHRAVLDATLPYFDRTGPLPQGLILPVFGAFLMMAFAVVSLLTGIGVLVRVRGTGRFVGGMVVSAVVLGLGYGTTDTGALLPWWSAALCFAAGGAGAWWLERRPEVRTVPLTLRGASFGALVLAGLTYPVLYGAAQDKQRARIEDLAEEFADGEDARVAFALEGVLLDARASGSVREALLVRRPVSGRAPQFDSLATDLVTGSLLAALADYTVGLAFLSPGGDTLGHHREVPPPGASPEVFGVARGAPDDPLSFRTLRRRYTADTAPGFVVEREPAAEGGKFRYAGIGPVRRDRDGAVLGWVTARAEPKPARYVSETPFPRVLVPAGLAGVVESELDFAEFRDGVLVRTRGDDYGRFRLPPAVSAALRDREAVWRSEQVGSEPARVYYRKGPGTERVVAVREPGVVVYDHLYFYLRLLLPALVLALGAYAASAALRRRAGVEARRSRLRDRVLNRFLFVGVVSIALTGLIGQDVVVTQNREAVEERLKRRLARVEDALYTEAAGGRAPAGPVPFYRLLDRARPDVVGPRLGLDVNLYRGADLVASSRSQLVRQRLIDRRLPVEVYETLFVDGERYAFAEEHIGTFTYTTGYEALPDTTGRPGAVIAVPTLPEQIAIEAEQARMVAYLFGVLLLLLVGIFFITTLLANDLTRPFRRLREGLLAVGAGEGGEPIPVESRDEVGEVIETFNAMRHQLEESRRRLAQQERELAWREMARQVAHEIKNPLTPMKLSVQHLRRAHHDQASTDETEKEARFGTLLDRITGTLIEQIDALTRIANEFSSFARLPERHLERLDLNEVAREAATLLGEEPHAEIVLALSPAPLPVEADREELRRVYINLLKNALQAMPQDERGTVTVRTERRTENGAAWVWSAVRDTGTGIPEHARASVFQPNFSTKTSGMGLGLAITKKAVEELGGEISFETEPGVGTAFFIGLPLAEEEMEREKR